MKTVVFLDTVHEVLWDELSDLGWKCIDLTKTQLNEAAEELQKANGLVVRSRIPVNRQFLEPLQNLEFIARSGAGMENIDIDYCNDRGIKLFNAPEGNMNAVAEHGVGMILSLFNKLREGDRQIREGVWDREGNRGYELEGKTVGIIGFGHNGSAFAKVLCGFGCSVIAFDKYKSDYANERVEEVSLQELKSRAHIISFHVPQNEETIYYFDDEFLNSLTKPIYLINMSRGKVVSTDSLLTGLDSGKILGACLDVLEFEKSSFEDMFGEDTMPDNFKKLLSLDNVLLSPHVAGWTFESYEKLSRVMLEKIKAEYGLN